jgi:hypothetical protein
LEKTLSKPNRKPHSRHINQPPKARKRDADYGEAYCFDCSQPYRRTSTYLTAERCPECKQKYLLVSVVYDRELGIGQIPTNLLKDYPDELL